MEKNLGSNKLVHLPRSFTFDRHLLYCLYVVRRRVEENICYKMIIWSIILLYSQYAVSLITRINQ